MTETPKVALNSFQVSKEKVNINIEKITNPDYYRKSKDLAKKKTQGPETESMPKHQLMFLIM